MNLLKNSYVNGLSLLGGEPLEPANQEGLLPLVKRVKEELPEKDIWCWTGYQFETDILNKMNKENKVTKELLNYIDIIVDGQFEIENKVEDLAFRGSTNQCKIDVQESLKKDKIVKLEFGDEARYETQKPKVMYFESFKKPEKVLTKTLENSTITVNFNPMNTVEENVFEQSQIEIKEEKETIAAKGID